MLVLSRKEGESIFIGDIEVMVVGIRDNKVRLGITAPVDVPVHRSEIYHLVKQETQSQKKQVTDGADHG